MRARQCEKYSCGAPAIMSLGGGGGGGGTTNCFAGRLFCVHLGYANISRTPVMSTSATFGNTHTTAFNNKKKTKRRKLSTHITRSMRMSGELIESLFEKRSKTKRTCLPHGNTPRRPIRTTEHFICSTCVCVCVMADALVRGSSHSNGIVADRFGVACARAAVCWHTHPEITIIICQCPNVATQRQEPIITVHGAAVAMAQTRSQMCVYADRFRYGGICVPETRRQNAHRRG